MTNLKQFCPRGHDTFAAGRDSSYRCLACKREAMWEASRAREAEEAAIRRAERDRQRAEWEQARKAERARIIKAGGPAAVEERWHEAFSLACDEDSGLCQWPQENNQPGGCFQRTEDVYCADHDRVLEQEREEYRRQRT